jgi:CRP/FNR family cyclic AMP-dependent transcriptional regulator
MAQHLQHHDWFSSLVAEHKKLVMTTTQLVRFPANSFIARRGELSEYWIGVHEGLIKLAVYNADGRSSTLSGVPEGGWCGEGSVIKRECRRYDVIAVRASRILLTPADTFHRLMAESLPFNSFVIRQLNERMGQFIATLQNERLLDVDACVAQAIAQLFHPMLYPRTSPVLELSQEEIGLLTGLSRQRVNQAMRHLTELGLVEVSYQSLRVVNLEGLRSFGIASL